MYDRFIDLMKAKGYKNVTQVSNLTGIPRSTFTDWKKGRSTPKIDKLKTLADFLRVDVSVFLEDSVQNIGQKDWYNDPEAVDLAQAMFDDPDLHALMDAARDCRPEYIKSAVQLLKTLKETNIDG